MNMSSGIVISTSRLSYFLEEILETKLIIENSGEPWERETDAEVPM